MNVAVILAGGKGLRLGSKTPKQMLNLGTKPVISWSVDTFHKVNLVDKIIIVSEKDLMHKMRLLFPATEYPKILSFIEGGAERSDSSYNAIISAEFNEDDIFLFHDAARPFITEEIIINVINASNASGACGTYIQSTDTIAIMKDKKINSIPERKSAYSAQTPQGFKYRIIKTAHESQNKNKNVSVTDDASLVFNLGIDVTLVEGFTNNIKITTELDFRFAEFLISGGVIC